MNSTGGAAPRLSPPSTGSTSPTTPPPSAAKKTNSPTLASRRKVNTASVALSSPKSAPICGNGKAIAF